METLFNYNEHLCDVYIDPQAQVSIGSNVGIGVFSSLEVQAGAKLILGERVRFHDSCTIRCLHHIEIGKDTMFGDGVRLYDNNHKYHYYYIEKMLFNVDSIINGKNCWIGSNVTILKGVTIEDNVIIGANCLIYKDIPSNSVVTCQQGLTIKERYQAPYHCLTVTMSDNLEQLRYLAEQLPEVDFHVTAPTTMSPYLESFGTIPNVVLYPNLHPRDIIDDLLAKSDFYLDINHFDEVDGIVGRALEANKAVYAFSNTVKRSDESIKVFSEQTPGEMVAAIRAQLESVYDSMTNG